MKPRWLDPEQKWHFPLKFGAREPIRSVMKSRGNDGRLFRANDIGS